MTIQFHCPHCDFHTEVADRFAGQSGSCASCQKPITVPGNPIQPTSAKPKSSSGGLIVAAVIGLTLIGAALFGMLFMVATGAKSPIGSAIGGIGGIGGPQSMASVKDNQTCCDNLERIGEAIAKYVEDKGHFPPAYVADKDGNIMHSWRVLLLPYLGEHELFAKYDMSKPWDDALNLPIIGRMPDVYLCPTERDVTDEANYMIINGPDYLFHKDQKRKPIEIKDVAAHTIMVVEVANSGIQWTEPKDLDVAEIDWNRNRQKGLGSKHPAGGLHVLMADGSVYHLGEFVTPEALTSMATVDGGEPVDPASWAGD